MKILVTGSNGQLGYDVLKELHRRKIPCRGIDREECDITNMPQVMHWVETYQPDAVIHCAAYTNVNRAETEQTLCMDINYRGSANIAAAANKTGAKLIYISTDYVFGASGEQPLGIYEAKNPLNTYGETKLSGENSTRILCPRSFIVRTSWVFGINGSLCKNDASAWPGKRRDFRGKRSDRLPHLHGRPCPPAVRYGDDRALRHLSRHQRGLLQLV